jgi:predicted phage terminase large subunit-like protein
MWHIVEPKKPIWNWHIEYLCDELQEVAERVIRGEAKPYDLIINMPPGQTKSLIVSIMFPAWLWTVMPSAKIICASYYDDLTVALSVKSRMIIESDEYKRLFPWVQLSHDQNAKHLFRNTSLGERKSVTVGGGVTGSHADFVIIDDPLNPKGARSDAELREANLWMSETIPSRVTDAKITPLILVMQRLHQNDPTGFSLERDKAAYHHICLPAELSDEVSPKRLKRYYKNGLMNPHRLDHEVLAKKKKELGAYGYAGQYQQTPIPDEGAMFDASLMWTTIKPLPAPLSDGYWTRLCRYWDKAYTGGSGCYTVGVLMGETREGTWWVLDVVRGQWATEEREQVIHTTAELDGDGVIIGVEEEPAAGKESAAGTVRRLVGYRVFTEKVGVSKPVRADELSVQVNAGNVYLAAAPWNRAFIEEFAFFPFGTYKDQVDAAAGAARFIFKGRTVVGRMGARSKTQGRGHLRGSKTQSIATVQAMRAAGLGGANSTQAKARSTRSRFKG